MLTTFLFAVTLAASWECSQGFLARVKHTPSDPSCPNGYGDGCENFWSDVGGADKAGTGEVIDQATRKKVADILSGIITNLSKKPVPRLVEIAGAVSRNENIQAVQIDTQARRVLGSLLSALQGRSTGDAARLLTSLTGTKVDEQSAASVAGMLANSVHYDSAICPFGFGCGGGGGPIDPATKAQVANILKGIISSMSHHKSLAQVSVGGRMALGSLLATLQSSHSAKGVAVVTELTGAKADAKALAAALSQMLKTSDVGMLSNSVHDDSAICPFGFGCGGGGPIDPATKAQVANILKGIISHMSNHKSLAQVSVGGRMALGSLLATLQSSHSANGVAVVTELTGAKADTKALVAALSQMLKTSDCPFGYGCGGGGPISSATKAQVANILKGIIGNLSHR